MARVGWKEGLNLILHSVALGRLEVLSVVGFQDYLKEKKKVFFEEV